MLRLIATAVVVTGCVVVFALFALNRSIHHERLMSLEREILTFAVTHGDRLLGAQVLIRR
jgi:hypothetical protein